MGSLINRVHFNQRFEEHKSIRESNITQETQKFESSRALWFHYFSAISLTVCLLRRLVSFAFPPRFVTISFGEMQRKARERVQQKVRNWKQEKNGNELGPRLAMRRRFVCVRWKLYVAHWSHWPVGNQSKVDLKRPSKSVSSEYRS